MSPRPELPVGLGVWRSLALAATAVVVHTLGSATPTQAYCAYVAERDASSVLVIDTATNMVTPVHVDTHSAQSIAVTPDSRFLYVANPGDNRHPDNTVTVIDTATLDVAATITVASPLFVAIAPNGRFAYVANSGHPPSQPGNTVSVIDTATALTDPIHAVTGTAPVGDFPFALAISPDSGFAYVTSCGSNCGGAGPPAAVTVVDTASNTARASLPGAIIVGAFSPDGQFAYGADQFLDVVAVIDTAKALTDPSQATIRSIPVGKGPYGLAVTPHDHFVYVTNCGEKCSDAPVSSASSISVIDTTVNAVAGTISLPPASAPSSVAITPDGALAYVTNSGSNTVAVIDTTKALSDPLHAIITTIPVGDVPIVVAISSLPMCVGGRPTCVGDCGVDRQVTVSEIITMVNVALGSADVSACTAGDANGDGQITVNEIITAVNHALSGC